MDLAVGAIVVIVLVASVLARRGVPPWSHNGRGTGTAADHDVPARMHSITDAAALDPLFDTAHVAPAILFLHDPGCPISRAAYRQMVRLDADIPLIDVRRAHALSRIVEERTGVRHESPQAIVLRQGRAVWSASHQAITTDAVAGALRLVYGEAP